MAAETYKCRGCSKTLELDFGTSGPWNILGAKGGFHDLNRGKVQMSDDDVMGDLALCGPMTKIDHEFGEEHAIVVPNEHQRLADAASNLIGAIHPGFVGDLPEALEALREAVEDGDVELVTVLQRVSRA